MFGLSLHSVLITSSSNQEKHAFISLIKVADYTLLYFTKTLALDGKLNYNMSCLYAVCKETPTSDYVHC